MIIGLTGKNAAGKGEIAKHLQSRGFIYFSLSDALRDEATRRKLGHSRDTLNNLGNELRRTYGNAILAKRINEKIRQEQDKGKRDFIIDSIRNPGEISELKKNEGFLLVGVVTDEKIRFERLLRRGRIGDAKTLKELKEHEQRENLNKNTSQQLDATLKMAKFIVANDGSLEELHKKIYDLIKIISTQS